MKYAICFSDAISPEVEVGGKAHHLAALQGAKFSIPAWFVFCPVGDEEAPSESRWESDLLAAYDQLCPSDELVAVRSSAMGEDSGEHSFAGQYDSFLFVGREDLVSKVKAVWRSAQSAHLETYRRESGAERETRLPRVLIQKMIDASCAGVAFSVDPVQGDADRAIVSSVFGLGSGLVSGECDADNYVIDREDRLVDKTILVQASAHRMDRSHPEGISPQVLSSAQGGQPSLEDSRAVEVAQLARAVAEHFGCPQDIEWAYDSGGKLWLLQARPVTTLAKSNGGETAIWDNSNIAESYSGVTTPLTFSFASRIYAAVYEEFCRMLRVPEKKIAASHVVFQNMLGHIQGRIYYHLINWYRVLALLPGYQLNRAFMEEMMGVKKALPENIAQRIRHEQQGGKWSDLWNLGRTAVGLWKCYGGLNRQIARFYQRLELALTEIDRPLAEYDDEQLLGAYRTLESRLLRRWDAPLVNDFFAMIFFGALGKISERWLGGADGRLAAIDLIVGQDDMVSLEPARRMVAMAEMVSGREDLERALQNNDLATLRRHEPWAKAWDAYLEKFGDRCLEELKLESPTLHDDPAFLLGSIKAQLSQGSGRKSSGAEKGRADAEKKIEQLPFWKRFIYRWILRQARARVRDRENLRLERTRLFGRVRKMMVELGRRLSSAGVIASERDIFYLEIEEIFRYYEGRATTTNLEELVALRRREYDGFRADAAPPDRFITEGSPYAATAFSNDLVEVPVEGDGVLRGIGCCSGVVRGRVRVVRDPREATISPGEILVAPQTDPGWVMLFPLAAGLLVERGSLLSHSAIVSREMGIPAVVSLPGICDWLRDGDEVEMDGQRGMVRKLELEREAA